MKQLPLRAQLVLFTTTHKRLVLITAIGTALCDSLLSGVIFVHFVQLLALNLIYFTLTRRRNVMWFLVWHELNIFPPFDFTNVRHYFAIQQPSTLFQALRHSADFWQYFSYAIAYTLSPCPRTASRCPPFDRSKNTNYQSPYLFLTRQRFFLRYKADHSAHEMVKLRMCEAASTLPLRHNSVQKDNFTCVNCSWIWRSESSDTVSHLLTSKRSSLSYAVIRHRVHWSAVFRVLSELI